jgi:3-phenylpropionate/trans-cinnamate dioxygenase ferredoxin subunit
MSAEWIDVGASGDVVEGGQSLAAEIDGLPVSIVRSRGLLYAFEDRCTHDGEPLDDAPVEDDQVICPRHGARFCLRTGEALTPPAYEPLRLFRVREQDGRIELAAATP